MNTTCNQSISGVSLTSLTARSRAWHWTPAFLLAALALGCGGSEYDLAPVSGVVTLDGQPVPQAIVVFQPAGGKDKPNPGPSSSGSADAQGHYELKTLDGAAGAVVGSHRVKITTPRPPQNSANDSGIGQPVHKEIIPSRYNENTELTFDVPADGSTSADFKLTTKP